MKNRYKQKLIFVIAILCLSLVSCKSKTDRETTADEFVQVYLGQHAELKSSSELQLDRKEEKIQKLVVAWELSAAETENGADLPKDEIWYFGFPKNKVLFCAKLLDENAELEFETIMRTLKY